MNKKARFSAGFFIFKTMSQRLKKRMIVTKMVIFEYRSGAYLRYVSTGTQEIAICSPIRRFLWEFLHILS